MALIGVGIGYVFRNEGLAETLKIRHGNGSLVI